MMNALSLAFATAFFPSVVLACPTATVYKPSYHGKLMANNKPYNHFGLSAASPSLRLGTKIRVKHKNHSLVLRVTDRMPTRSCVALDLSGRAADLLHLHDYGKVQITILR